MATIAVPIACCISFLLCCLSSPTVAAGVDSNEALFRPQQRLFNGSYTLVNKASGRRISSSVHGFAATFDGVVHPHHRWNFLTQGNGTYTIVNAANGMRIFAQAGRQNEDGFLTIDHGPIYQDQKWMVLPQADASYILVNSRSGRRMLATVGVDGANGFLAVAGDGPILEDHRWFIINADVDEAGPCLLQLADLKSEQRALRQQLQSEVPVAADVRPASTISVSVASDILRPEEIPNPTVAAYYGDYCNLLAATVAVMLFTAWAFWHRVLRALGLFSSALRGCTHLPRNADCDVLGGCFSYQIFSAEVDEKPARLVKIECPGVEHDDIEIDILSNGCEVTIRRKASLGVQARVWKKQFEFELSDGLFEFREDLMQLESGFLQLTLQARAFRGRNVRFPTHYNMSSTDCDRCWEFSAESETGDGNEDADTTVSGTEGLGSDLSVQSQETSRTRKSKAKNARHSGASSAGSSTSTAASSKRRPSSQASEP